MYSQSQYPFGGGSNPAGYGGYYGIHSLDPSGQGQGEPLLGATGLLGATNSAGALVGGSAGQHR
jgi:hypothetical protein